MSNLLKYLWRFFLRLVTIHQALQWYSYDYRWVSSKRGHAQKAWLRAELLLTIGMPQVELYCSKRYLSQRCDSHTIMSVNFAPNFQTVLLQSSNDLHCQDRSTSCTTDVSYDLEASPVSLVQSRQLTVYNLGVVRMWVKIK